MILPYENYYYSPNVLSQAAKIYKHLMYYDYEFTPAKRLERVMNFKSNKEKCIKT